MIASQAAVDVFISYAFSDREIALKVMEGLKEVGLAPFPSGDSYQSPKGEAWADVVWNSLAESKAVIVVYSSELTSSPSVGFEVGAAAAWNKPIFVLLSGPATTSLPPMLANLRTYPLQRLDDVIRAIQAVDQPLSDRDVVKLGELYQKQGVPADKLSLSAKELQRITQEFNQDSGKYVSGEMLLSELLRLRKRGELPRIQRKTKAELD